MDRSRVSSAEMATAAKVVLLQKFSETRVDVATYIYPELTHEERTRFRTGQSEGKIFLSRIHTDFRFQEHAVIPGRATEPPMYDYEVWCAKTEQEQSELMKRHSLIVLENYEKAIGLDDPQFQDFSIKAILSGEEENELPLGFREYEGPVNSDWTYTQNLLQEDKRGNICKVAEYLECDEQAISEEENVVYGLMNFSPASDNKLMQAVFCCLRRLNSFTAPQGNNNMLQWEKETILGVNTIQLFLKREGVITPLHQEDRFAVSINVCLKGSSKWIAVRPEDAQAVEHLAQKKNAHFMKHMSAVYPIPSDLHEIGVDTIEWIQKKGQLVISSPGNCHWVKGLEESSHVAYNTMPLQANQIHEASLYDYYYHRSERDNLVRFKALVVNGLIDGRFTCEDKQLWQELVNCLWRITEEAVNVELVQIQENWPQHSPDDKAEWESLDYKQQNFCDNCNDEMFSRVVLATCISLLEHVTTRGRKCKKQKFTCLCVHCAKESTDYLASKEALEHKQIVRDMLKVEDTSRTTSQATKVSKSKQNVLKAGVSTVTETNIISETAAAKKIYTVVSSMQIVDVTELYKEMTRVKAHVMELQANKPSSKTQAKTNELDSQDKPFTVKQKQPRKQGRDRQVSPQPGPSTEEPSTVERHKRKRQSSKEIVMEAVKEFNDTNRYKYVNRVDKKENMSDEEINLAVGVLPATAWNENEKWRELPRITLYHCKKCMWYRAKEERMIIDHVRKHHVSKTSKLHCEYLCDDGSECRWFEQVQKTDKKGYNYHVCNSKNHLKKIKDPRYYGKL